MMRRVWVVWLAISLFGIGAVEGREAKRTVQAAIGTDGVQRVSIVGGSYFFDPYHVVVKANVPVELSVRKESGVVPHDIVVKAPETGIDFTENLSSSPKVIKFVPSKPGKYPMYCSKKLPLLPSHQEKGMEGILEVVE